MLKTNSKKVQEKIRKWILDDADSIQDHMAWDIEHGSLPASIDLENVNNLCKYVYDDFVRVMGYRFGRYAETRLDNFCEYAAGLPFGNLFIYYYNVSAVDLVGDILEETETERNRFSESDAEFYMSKMLYNFILSAADKADF